MDSGLIELLSGARTVARRVLHGASIMKRFVPSRRCGTALLRSIFAAGFALLACAPFASAQQHAPQPPPAATTVALPLAYPTEFDGDLRNLPQTYTPPEYYLLLNEYEEPPNQKPPPGPEALRPQPAVQMLGPMPASTNFPGLGLTTAVNGGQAGGGWPPDTNGDVGPTYYIQSVNTAFGIFNKSTGALVTSFTINQLWASSGTSTICLNQNRGDPVVMHDARNDRWLIIDFAFGTSAGKPAAPFYQCIAVSKTGDPVSGGWRFYAVQVDTGASGGPPTGTLNDYLKFGLWNDGCLYMGANGFTEPAGTYAGSIVASFSTTDMYAGNPLTSSIGFLSYGSANEFSLFPADLLGSSAGSLPPAGTPEYFVSESQSIYGLNVRKFTPGSNCGGGGSVSAATSVPHASYTYNGGHFIPQQGSTTLLDSLEDRVMQRVQYRKIGSAESLWVVHTTGSTPAQPQWVQVNVSGGTIVTTPVQQQIYAPDTTKYRWMPALAVDQQGNMAMGYSRSSATDYPSIYYAGRLAGDPANTLPQSEVAMVTGGGGQNNTCGGAACYRWGDYSSMTIDPSDDCTFWYTTEYYDTQTNGNSGNWQTRIGSFKFPGCNSYTLTYTTDGNGAISGTTPQTVITGGSGTAVTAVPNANYRFVKWSDNSVANPRTDTNVTASISVQAQFVRTYTIGGSVSGLTGANMVGLTLTDTTTSGTQVQSYANVGFTFPTALASGDSWNVAVTTQPTGQTCGVSNGSGTNLSANVTNVTVTCTTNTYTLTYDTDGNGTISGTTPQTGVTYGTNGTAVTAVPNAGYHFVQWSDASITNPRTDTNVTTGISVTAQFAANVLVFTTQPTTSLNRGNSLGTVAVTEQDGSGNAVSDTATVDFTAATPCGALDLGSVAMIGGVATLNSAQRFYALQGYQITATVTVPNPTPMAAAPSSTFNVISGTDFVFSDGFESCRP